MILLANWFSCCYDPFLYPTIFATMDYGGAFGRLLSYKWKAFLLNESSMRLITTCLQTQ